MAVDRPHLHAGIGGSATSNAIMSRNARSATPHGRTLMAPGKSASGGSKRRSRWRYATTGQRIASAQHRAAKNSQAPRSRTAGQGKSRIIPTRVDVDLPPSNPSCRCDGAIGRSSPKYPPNDKEKPRPAPPHGTAIRTASGTETNRCFDLSIIMAYVFRSQANDGLTGDRA